ncbi:MAG: hypothetical protein EPN61_17560 [Burkholderiaceae bacterium]|nr:MAG: hypothetical protein EPN61_17560 [Burkholderiaceae bacterium]
MHSNSTAPAPEAHAVYTVNLDGAGRVRSIREYINLDTGEILPAAQLNIPERDMRTELRATRPDAFEGVRPAELWAKSPDLPDPSKNPSAIIISKRIEDSRGLPNFGILYKEEPEGELRGNPRGRPAKVHDNGEARQFLSRFSDAPDLARACPAADNILAGAAALQPAGDGSTRPLSKDTLLRILRHLDSLTVRAVQGLLPANSAERTARRYTEAARVASKALSGYLRSPAKGQAGEGTAEARAEVDALHTADAADAEALSLACYADPDAYGGTREAGDFGPYGEMAALAGWEVTTRPTPRRGCGTTDAT